MSGSNLESVYTFYLNRWGSFKFADIFLSDITLVTRLITIILKSRDKNNRNWAIRYFWFILLDFDCMRIYWIISSVLNFAPLIIIILLLWESNFLFINLVCFSLLFTEYYKINFITSLIIAPIITCCDVFRVATESGKSLEKRRNLILHLL